MHSQFSGGTLLVSKLHTPGDKPCQGGSQRASRGHVLGDLSESHGLCTSVSSHVELG